MVWPTEAAALAFANLTAVVNHVGLPGPVLAALEEQLGSFGDSIGALACIPEQVMRDTVRNARVITRAFVAAGSLGGGNPAADIPRQDRIIAPVETGQIGMVWRICARIMWTQSGSSWDDYPDFDVMVPPADRLTAFRPTAAPAAAAAPASSPYALEYKMNMTVDQGDESKFPAPTRAETDTWNANYFAQEQTIPPEDEEATEIQVKGLDVRTRASRTPYVDFAIWGPYGNKLLRSLKFRVWVPNGDGTFTQKEMQGPENFLVYVKIWRVFMTAAKMIRAVEGWALNL